MARQIVILGNGIAGTTAARHIRKRSDDEITLVSAETDYFFSRTALMYIYMGHMTFEDTKPYEDAFWDRNRIHRVRAWVDRIDVPGRRLHLEGRRGLPWDVLILATGSRSNRFGWPGQDLRGVQGLYSYPDLESMERNTAGTDRAVIVGGGLIGVETAEMLRSRGIAVTFLVREASWMEFAFPEEESSLINREILRHGVDLRLSTELERILPDERGGVRGVRTKQGEEIPCGFVALTVGVSPNIETVRQSEIECDRGILVDDHLRTSVPDVYAIGDCAQLRTPQPGRRPIEPVWYTGRTMGQAVAANVSGAPQAYDPGIWFNSAKFFDLEWQVYGEIPARLPDEMQTLYWEDPSGTRSIRINYRRGDRAVTGFNLIGVRYRHTLCESWIREGRDVRQVLEQLGAANFDPELFAQYEGEVVRRYNAQNPGAPLRLRSRRGLRAS